MASIFTIFKYFLQIFLRTKSLSSLTNLLKGDISLPNKILLFKRNKLSGHIKIGEGISLIDVAISGEVKIGKFCSINGPGTFLIGAYSEIEIGNFCSIARNVQIQGVYHNYNRATSYSIIKSIFKERDIGEFIVKGKIVIEDDVWIGANSVILSGVKIGRGSVIAAGSIVTKDVEPYSIVGGNPAKKIRFRFTEEVISELENSQWWMWDESTILKNRSFFKRDFNQQ